MNAEETKRMTDFISKFKSFSNNRAIILECFKKFASLEVKKIDDLLIINKTFFPFMKKHIDCFGCDFFTKLLLISALSNFKEELDLYLSPIDMGIRKGYAEIVGEVLPKGANSKILDVGSGSIALSSVLLGNKTQKKIDSVDFDKFLIDQKLANFLNVNLMNVRFTKATNIDAYDLLVGFAPCAATKALVENASSHNKPYFIRSCNCGMPEDKRKEDMDKAWLAYLRDVDPHVKVKRKFIYNLDISESVLSDLIQKHQQTIELDIHFEQEQIEDAIDYLDSIFDALVNPQEYRNE